MHKYKAQRDEMILSTLYVTACTLAFCPAHRVPLRDNTLLMLNTSPAELCYIFV